MNKMDKQLLDSPLGKATAYVSNYDAKLLHAIERQNNWSSYDYKKAPYTGYDMWNAYELSWLNKRGLPQVAMAEICIPCDSPNLIESKSLKLYLNSLNQTHFDQAQQVCEQMQADLSDCAGAPITLNLVSLDDQEQPFKKLTGQCLDQLDVEIKQYTPDRTLLQRHEQRVQKESYYSHLLKSNCPITGQPDWASIFIQYSGQKIDPEGLLKYIVSYRNHGDFHEQCCEIIFLDILQQCQPDELTIQTRYLRRGGLDINPLRSTEPVQPHNTRLIRQ